ncbi:MAG: hypothetical protein H8E53_10370, partial [Planctomycetes bacterium]|nr:hypothetical protein [Planctomycetota bacterium]
MLTVLCLPVILSGAARPAKLPDIKSVPPDLKTPEMVDGAAAAGKRVKQVAPEYKGTQ